MVNFVLTCQTRRDIFLTKSTITPKFSLKHQKKNLTLQILAVCTTITIAASNRWNYLLSGLRASDLKVWDINPSREGEWGKLMAFFLYWPFIHFMEWPKQNFSFHYQNIFKQKVMRIKKENSARDSYRFKANFSKLKWKEM